MKNIIQIKVKKFTPSPVILDDIILKALKKRNAKNKIVELIVVGKVRMAYLNKKYMHKSGPTDVLSFPLEEIPSEKVHGKHIIGTIVVCNDIIKMYVKQSGNVFLDETEKLIFHGVDHLLGIHHK